MSEPIAADLLKQCREYVLSAKHQAEARHDNPEGDYYLDGAQYEVAEEAGKLVDAIDKFFRESGRDACSYCDGRGLV